MYFSPFAKQNQTEICNHSMLCVYAQLSALKSTCKKVMVLYMTSKRPAPESKIYISLHTVGAWLSQVCNVSEVLPALYLPYQAC